MKTAWHDERICEHILNANFPPLAHSDHFPSLYNCIQHIGPEYKKLIDIGCCTAEFAVAFPYFDYCGADLPHIIERVAKRKHPDLEYVPFDAQYEDFNFLKYFDIIFMNSFLSEMQNPLEILNKILSFASKYIIIHRQDILELDREYKEEVYPTYGGLDTINTVINRSDFDRIVKENNCSIESDTESFEGLPIKRTILIVKND